MKAFLLAAGYGTRLRPLTETVPKCLVPVHGRPLLEYWLLLFEKYGVTEVLINTHYLADAVRKFINEYNCRNTGVYICETYEPKLLGSAGTVRANRDFVTTDESFYICYADSLTNADLGAFKSFHDETDGVLSIALFRTNLPHQCGIVELDEDGRITAFAEKPEHPKSNLANAGIYIARRGIFDYLNEDTYDFGKDVLPRLTGKMFGWHTKGYVLDIGIPENYITANEEADIW